MGLITINQAAEKLSVNSRTFRTWINRGAIPQEVILKIGSRLWIKVTKFEEFLGV